MGHRDLVYTSRVERDRHHGSAIEVVLDRNNSPCIFKILLNQGKARSRAADITLLVAIGRRDAKLEGQLFILDSRSLICKTNCVSPIENRDDRFHEMGVDEVFHDFTDNHHRDGAALLFHIFIHRVGDFFEVGACCLRRDDNDARCREHIVIDSDARGVAHARGLLLLGGVMLLRFTGEMGVVGCRIPRVHEGVEIV